MARRKHRSRSGGRPHSNDPRSDRGSGADRRRDKGAQGGGFKGGGRSQRAAEKGPHSSREPQDPSRTHWDSGESSAERSAPPAGGSRHRHGQSRTQPPPTEPRSERHRHRAAAASDRQSPRGGPGRFWIYGRHAVESALGNPDRRLQALICTPEAAESLAGMRRRAGRALPETEIVARADLEARLPEGAVHQGMAAQCVPLADRALSDLLAERPSDAPALLVGLDQVTDPQNVGAVLRSAAAFGADGLILTERHAAPESGALARAASGALEVTPLVRVGNLAKALDELKAAGFWIFGLAGEATDRLDAVDLPERLVLLLGAEGSGLRRLTRERCDRLVRLPTGGPVDQLNVSNAAAVALYEVARRRR